MNELDVCKNKGELLSEINHLREENGRLRKLVIEVAERLYAAAEVLSRVAEKKEMRGKG